MLFFLITLALFTVFAVIFLIVMRRQRKEYGEAPKYRMLDDE